jgi:hypothetical protein
MRLPTCAKLKFQENWHAALLELITKMKMLFDVGCGE